MIKSPSEMTLPSNFIQTIHKVFGENGENFIRELPNSIAEVSERWNLSHIQPVPNLSYNFVAFAKRHNENVILKMGVPNRELTSEIAALQFFNGNGICCLLEADATRGLLLLERLEPGTLLSELADDDERTHIAVGVMQNLWQPLGTEQQAIQLQHLIQLSDWFAGLKKIRPHFDGRTGPFPKELLERVASVLPELFADEKVKLLHGDFHHFNILSSKRGWLAIDPKGVIGPVGYEVGPLMLNPWQSISDRSIFKVRAQRRVAIIAEQLGWERKYILQWATAHAVLSTWWDMEDGMDWKYPLWCAERFHELLIELN